MYSNANCTFVVAPLRLEAKDDRALQIAGHPSHDALLGHVLGILTLTFQVQDQPSCRHT